MEPLGKYLQFERAAMLESFSRHQDRDDIEFNLELDSNNR